MNIDTSPAAVERLVDELNKARQCIFLACDAAVAADIATRFESAAATLTALAKERDNCQNVAKHYEQQLARARKERDAAEAARDALVKRVEELEARATLAEQDASATADQNRMLFQSIKDRDTATDALRAENERLRGDWAIVEKLCVMFGCTKEFIETWAALGALNTERLGFIERSGLSVIKDELAEKSAWACFEAYPERPQTTAHPFPMFDTPHAAIDAALAGKDAQYRVRDRDGAPATINAEAKEALMNEVFAPLPQSTGKDGVK